MGHVFQKISELAYVIGWKSMHCEKGLVGYTLIIYLRVKVGQGVE